MKTIMPIENSRIWRGVASFMRVALVICGACLIILVGMSVFLRYILHTSFVGTDDLIVLFAIWLYWLGGAYGSYEGSHISADLTNVFIKNEKLKSRINIVVKLITALIAGVFAYWSIAKYAIWNIQAGTTTTGLRIPYLTSNIALTICLCLMFMYAIYHFVRAVVPEKDIGIATLEEGGIE